LKKKEEGKKKEKKSVEKIEEEVEKNEEGTRNFRVRVAACRRAVDSSARHRAAARRHFWSWRERRAVSSVQTRVSAKRSLLLPEWKLES